MPVRPCPKLCRVVSYGGVVWCGVENNLDLRFLPSKCLTHPRFGWLPRSFQTRHRVHALLLRPGCTSPHLALAGCSPTRPDAAFPTSSQAEDRRQKKSKSTGESGHQESKKVSTSLALSSTSIPASDWMASLPRAPQVRLVFSLLAPVPVPVSVPLA